MFKSSPQKRWAVVVIAIAFLYFYRLGGHGLFEPDEGRYANMATEWTEFDEHNWTEPTLSDVAHFDKPPLIYWVTGTSFLLFGESEFSARLPSLLGSLMALIGVGLLAGRRHGERAACWAVVACATTIQFWAVGHLLSPDMLMCGFCTLGAGLLLWGGQGKKAWLTWLFGAIFWTLAWWTKATAALVPLAALAGALLFTGRRDLLVLLKPIRLLLFILIFGSPWYVLMMIRHEELKDFFLVHEVAGRIAGHADGRRGFIGYHFVIALVFWLPWWPLAVIEFQKHKVRWKSSVWNARRKMIPWQIVAALLVLTIFSFVSSKLITYTLPGVPLFAVWVGKTLAASSFSFQQWPIRIATGIAALLLCVASFAERFEHKLGRNSSMRKAVAIAKQQGAKWILSDEFRPGLEFYFGENIWYVGTKDITQVIDIQGQSPWNHFIQKDLVDVRMEPLNGPVFMFKFRRNPLSWQRRLIERRPKVENNPILIGDLEIWRVK